MEIFKKRPLCLILCIMLGGFSLFIRQSVGVRLCIAGIAGIIFTVIYTIFNKHLLKRTLYLVAIFAFIISVLLSILFTLISVPTKYFDKEQMIIGRVSKIDTSLSYNLALTVKTQKIGENKAVYTLLVYTPSEEDIFVKENDVITFRGEILEFSDNKNGFDEKGYYLSRGYDGYCAKAELLEITEKGQAPSRKLFQSVRSKLNEVFISVTDEHTGAFLSALLVGDRSGLDGNTKLNFTRIGISHILALSGMHLSILSFAINKLLSFIRVNRKARIITICVFSLFYMGLTDFLPSITRAGIMIILSNVFYLLMISRDSYTNLAISVFLITLFDPNSVYDISLWLSALATLGVIVIEQLNIRLPIRNKFLNKTVNSIINGLLFSVFAISATFLITALSFDSFSVIAPIGTILFSFIIQGFIYLGIVATALPFFGFLGKATVIYSDIIKELTNLVSSGKNTFVSYDSIFIKVIIAVYTASFAMYLILKIRKRGLGLISLCGFFAVIFTVGYVSNILSSNDKIIEYSSSDSCDVILMGESAHSLVYMGDCSSSSYYQCYELLKENNISYLEYLVIPNYRAKTPDFIERFISGIKTENVFIVEPENYYEITYALKISETLSIFSTDLNFYKERERIEVGGFNLYLLNHQSYSKGVAPKNALLITNKDNYISYLSSGILKDAPEIAAISAIASHTVILGSDGRSYPEGYKIKYSFEKADTLIIPSDVYLSDETAEYYNKKGVSVIYTETPISLNVE